ncbi:MAG TPA: nucleotide exchange factor GrpE [Longimicrobiaceae bacterium]|nr:nucleotide exchange factor GrpE [Longimicrobiaceae bacterium]
MTTDRPEDATDLPADDTAEAEFDIGAAPAKPEVSPDSTGQIGDTPEVLRERYLRLAAEYENFRKRTERERLESWNRAQAQLVENFLEPLDDLQRVAHFTGDKASVESLHEGVELVHRKLSRILEAAGLEEIPAEGRPFDPAVHEALMTVPTTEEAEDHMIGGVLQRGYLFKGILLRPARVQVRSYEG